MKITRARIIGLLAAALALACAFWLARSIEWVDVEVRTVPRNEAARDRFYAAKALVRRLGGQAVTRNSLDTLPPTGATLVLTSSHWNMFPGRDEALEHWVEGGGRLVLAEMPTIRETTMPAWLPIHVVADAAPASQSGAPVRRQRVDRCHVFSEPEAGEPAFGMARSYRVCGYASKRLRSRVEAQWSLQDLEGLRAMRVPVGRGSVTVSTLVGSFRNDAVAADDGALAFVATLGLRQGDDVWFVDDESRASLAELLWRSAAPAVLLALAALALWLWRAGARFGPLAVEPTPARRSIGEQIRRTAAFIAAGGGDALHRAALRSLEEAAARAIPGYLTLPSTDERAAAIARWGSGDAAVLAGAMQRPKRRHGLGATLAELERARRALLPTARAVQLANPPRASTS